MSKGGSSGTQQSEVTQTTSNLPEYAKPYYTSLLERGMYESARPYEAYPGQRIAQFSPLQGQAMQGIAGLQQPGQTGLATELATTVGLQPTNRGSQVAAGFNPTPVQTNYQAGQFTTGYTPGQFGAGYQAGTASPGYTAGTFNPNYQAGTFNSGYQAGTVSPGYTAGTFDSGYTAGGINADFQAGTMTDPNVIAQYMNPYQQLVTDVQKREATRVAAQQTPQIQAQATMSGAGGGTRESLLMAENERNLMRQLGDIQATGDQAAYNQALQAFEQDRGARLNQAQFGLDKYNAGEQARQRAAQMGLDARGQEEAARQAQAKFGLEAFSMQEQARQQQGAFSMDAQRAGEEARQRAAQMGLDARGQEEAARQAQAKFGLEAFSLQEQARQQQGKFALDAQSAAEQARQQAAQMGLDAQGQEEAARQAMERFSLDTQQFNTETQRQQAMLGLAGLESDQAALAQRLGSAELLGSLGQREQEMMLQRLQAQLQAGNQQQALGQQSLNMGYEDFLRQQAYGKEQLAYLSSLLQGTPIQPGSTVATYGRVPSTEQQLLGSGISALGLYNSLGKTGG